jgi:hypothetical protein
MFQRFDTAVRCSAGHFFTTIWIPGGSLKAVRLGSTRYQYCPVGHHWATVTRLDWDGTATQEDLAKAALVHDVRIP